MDEITISESLASALHVGVGDDLSFASFSPYDIEQADDAIAAHGPRVMFRIVGIVRRPLDLGGRGATGGVIVPTPAFLERYRDEIGSFSGAVLRVRTEHGSADVERVTQAARRIFRSPSFGVTSLNIEGQGGAERHRRDDGGARTWPLRSPPSPRWSASPSRCRARSRSATTTRRPSARRTRPRHRALAAGAIGIPVALVGALLAVVGAALASPIFPIGVAAKAEPDPGLRIDAAAIGIGLRWRSWDGAGGRRDRGLRTARATRVRAQSRPAERVGASDGRMGRAASDGGRRAFRARPWSPTPHASGAVVAARCRASGSSSSSRSWCSRAACTIS